MGKKLNREEVIMNKKRDEIVSKLQCSSGGWAAKIGAGALSDLLTGLAAPNVFDDKLLVGYNDSDDASVYQISEDVAVHFSTDKTLAGDILVIYKRLIHGLWF